MHDSPIPRHKARAKALAKSGFFGHYQEALHEAMTNWDDISFAYFLIELVELVKEFEGWKESHPQESTKRAYRKAKKCGETDVVDGWEWWRD